MDQDELAAPSRLHQMPTWLLSQASLHAHRLLTDAFDTAGARGYHYRLLAALEEYGPSSQADLGRRTGVDRSDVVSSVDFLVDHGYARRSRDAHDRRRNVVSLTPAGRRHYQRLDELVLDVQSRLLSALSRTERRALTELLRRVVDAAPSD